MRRMLLPLALVALLLGGCGGEDDPVVSGPTGSTPTPTESASPTGDPAAGTEIKAGDNAFNPRTLTVRVGTTVSVVNTGRAPHTFTSQPGQAMTWNHELPERGSTATVRFATAGSYDYVCTIHAAQGMTGTVVVTP